MRIAYVSPIDLAAPGGAAGHVWGIARGLAADARVDLFCYVRGKLEVPALPQNLTLHKLSMPGSSTMQCLMALSRESRAFLKREAVDVVYLRTFPLDYYLLSHRMAGHVPYVCEMNSMTDHEYRSLGKPLRGRLYATIEGRTLARASGWLPTTNEVANWAERLTGRRPPTMLAPNGVDLAQCRPHKTRAQVRAELGVPESTPVLAMAGFADPWHGADRAIAALAELPRPCELWLIGDRDPEKRRPLFALAERLGVANAVRFFPWLPPSEVATLCGAVDVGLGALALDRKQMREVQALKGGLYLALGLPMLINCQDLRFDDLPFVAHVDSHEPADLAKGIAALLALPDEVRAQIRPFAEQKLSWEAIARQTRTFIDDVLRSA
ncbi:MAG TPA: glycosyltransferase family 4 protein [Oscillatoriaceae cyanobacterium]